MNTSVRIAVCGVITALETLLMMITGVVTIGTYTFPALAGMLGMVLVMEFGARWAFMVYGAVSVLSVILAGDKEAVLLFILFFGYYPIVKAFLEKFARKVVVYCLKYLLFNVAVILSYWGAISFLGIPEDSFLTSSWIFPLLLLLLGNVIFFLYDFILSGFVISYWQRFHKIFAKWIGKK